MIRRLALPVATGVLFATAAASRAQVTTDSSLGTIVTPNGAAFDITGGTRPAGAPTNLFHSFGTFTVANGITANFDYSGVATDNIVARVTGGSRSDIFGTVQTTGASQANLFLLNPAGFMFGGNAQLNVDGSFTASTADYVVLSEGWRLDAAAGAPTFTVAGPTLFGFIDTSVAAIDVTALNAPLAVDAGKSLSLIGGRIGVATGPLGALAAPSGRIDVASVLSPGVVSLDAGIGMSGFTTLANIAVTNSTLNVDGVVTDAANSNGGEVFIRGGQFVVDQSTVTSATQGMNAGGRYDIDVATLEVRNNSEIATSTSGGGNAGGMTISADVINIRDSSITGNTRDSFSAFQGDGGMLEFRDVGTLTVDNGRIASNTIAGGDAGQLTFNSVGTLSVTNGGSISTDTDEAGTSGAVGEGGVIQLNGVGNVLLSDGGVISANSNSIASAGEIVITAQDRIDVGVGSKIEVNADGGRAGGLRLSANTLNVSGSVAATTAGRFGQGTDNFVIDAATVNVNAGGQISAISSGTATAGNIELRNVGALTVAGGSIQTDTLLALTDPTGGGQGGSAGSITASVNDLTISGGGRISSSTQSSGQGGTITINAAGTIAIRDTNSGIFTTTSARSANIGGTLRFGGDGGDVSLTAQRLDISAGSIDASTSGAGRGGSIGITGTATLNVSAGEISAVSTSTGAAGSIEITNAGTLTVASGGAIKTDTQLPLEQGAGGDAGDITASVNDLAISGGGRVSSSTQGSGRGGTIAITAAGNVALGDTGSGIFTTTTASTTTIGGSVLSGGDGGDVEVAATSVLLGGGASVSSSSFGQGDAGGISLVASDSIELRDGSFIRTTAEQSSGGDIVIRASDMLYLIDSEITTEAGGATPSDNGGDIDIDPAFVVLSGSNIIARANGGNGGNIFITAGTFIKDPSSVVNADSQQQTDGEIVIESPIQDVTAAVTILDPSFLDASRLLRERCSAASSSERSAFVLAGRGGVRSAPDEYLASVFAKGAGPLEPPNASTGSFDPHSLVTTARLDDPPFAMLELRGCVDQ